MQKQDEEIVQVSKNYMNDPLNGVRALKTELLKDRNPIKCEIKKDYSEDDNHVDVKKELDTFVFDKECYYREVKGENIELQNIVTKEYTNNYYTENVVTNYDDFQLKNEEVSIKSDLNCSDGNQSRTLYTQSVMQENSESSKTCSSRSRKRRQDINEYHCTQCEFTTKFKRSLNKHSLTHNNDTEVELFKCPECDYITKYKHNIKHHRLIHFDQSQVEMYKCEKCDYKTKRRSHLNSHMRVHSENPTLHFCDKCDYKTKHPGCLKKHITSHLKLGEAIIVYNCTYCDHQTKNKTRLRNHEQRHLKPQKCGEFKCFNCHYQANNKYLLIKHLKTHRQEKIKCEYCSYETVTQDRLDAHQKIHINVK